METGEIVEVLRRLFELTASEWPRIPGRPEAMVTRGDERLILQEEALAEREKLVRAISRSALEAGGPYPAAVESWTHDACALARSDPEAAIDQFFAQLSAPIQPWLVASPCGDVLLPAWVRDFFEIAGCEIRPEPPVGLPPDVADFVGERIGGQMILTTVEAHDRESASLVATDRFETAKAIMAAATPGDIRPDPGVFTSSSDSDDRYQHAREARVFPLDAVNPEGSERVLDNGWHELSDSAAPSGEQTEWSVRILTAARWLHRARTSWWSSERITACFAALEALVLPEHTRRKPTVLAERISARWETGTFDTQEELRAWLADLYLEERTSAVHLGRHVVRDLDARRLESLSSALLSEAIWHLTPFHRIPNAACSTLEEVFDDDLHT